MGMMECVAHRYKLEQEAKAAEEKSLEQEIADEGIGEDTPADVVEDAVEHGPEITE